MFLTRHATAEGPRWAADGRWLSRGLTLGTLLDLELEAMREAIAAHRHEEPASGPLLAPVEPGHEIWASGVTFLRSREARMVESETKDIYEKVYDAARVELFFKSPGWRARGPGAPVRVRRDSAWNVPEPELTLVINARGHIVGYTGGNDVSSRDIEGENPLYLPQAKIYDGACGLGPGITLAGPGELADVPIRLVIAREQETLFEGEVSTAQLKRTPEEMADWLFRELTFPEGVLLMTGTGVVPPDAFSLREGDRVAVTVGEHTLENPVTM